MANTTAAAAAITGTCLQAFLREFHQARFRAAARIRTIENVHLVPLCLFGVLHWPKTGESAVQMPAPVPERREAIMSIATESCGRRPASLGTVWAQSAVRSWSVQAKTRRIPSNFAYGEVAERLKAAVC